jgi:hypothetical protein
MKHCIYRVTPLYEAVPNHSQPLRRKSLRSRASLGVLSRSTSIIEWRVSVQNPLKTLQFSGIAVRSTRSQAPLDTAP